MFDGPAINELIALLERRSVSLYHACQYDDFRAYLRLGGIPSRALLEGSRQCFTPFETDAYDRHNGVWDKVFVNLADFGEWFARGLCAVPNPYGPIVLQLRPAAFREATDVAVCCRSAGAADFNREREALGRVEDVDRLFRNAADAGFPRSAYLKMASTAPTPGPAAGMPEVSCTVARGLLPLDYVIVAWTDPYVLGGRPLRAWVGEAMAAAGAGFRLWERSCHEERRPLYAELLAVVQSAEPSLHGIAHDPTRSPSLRAWAAGVQERGLAYQFRRYRHYLIKGTVDAVDTGGYNNLDRSH